MANMFNQSGNLTTIYVSEYDETSQTGFTTDNVTKASTYD